MEGKPKILKKPQLPKSDIELFIDIESTDELDYEEGTIKVDYLIGYPTKTKQGAELKSTTVFIRDNRDKIVGALCINIDITPYISLRNLSEQFCLRSEINEEEQFPEKFESNVDQLINELLEQSIKKNGKPIVHMRKEDKLQIIRDLKENGLFLIKGSAKRVSQELNVSLATIYK